jgi:L-lactate dehydrogenase
MKVGIVGTGRVGSTAAYALVLTGAATDIVLVDVNTSLARAEAEDILHATPLTNPVRVTAGDYQDLNGSDVVILACGASQAPGETRLHLLDRNKRIFEAVTRSVSTHAPGAILVVASNPVDILTYYVVKNGGAIPSKVIGSGTILDTARCRALLGEHLGMSPQSIHMHVLGEHGDSEVLAWSGADVGGVMLEEVARTMGTPITPDVKERIDRGVRRAAYTIIAGKGATNFGIGAGLARIVAAIRDDERAVFTVSNTESPGYEDVSLSLPRVVGSSGIIATLSPALSDAERDALGRSADLLRQARG